MTINDHSSSDQQKKLDRILRSQAELAKTNEDKRIYSFAENLSRIESALVVVSDIAKGTSRIFSGTFARSLGIDGYSHENSIWEKEILNLMTEKEQENKIITELRFFHYLRKIPKSHKSEYYLVSKLRFRNTMTVLHRMYYIYAASGDSVNYAICVYCPLIFDFPGQSFAVNAVTGFKEEITSSADNSIISKRERQVLELISSGMKSSEIARSLNISLNTVSRHRQEILSKLQVKNSVEACYLAKSMGLI